jgi:transposase
MEACGSASYWARELARLGHEVKLIAPQYVKPFVKRQKKRCRGRRSYRRRGAAAGDEVCSCQV